MVHSASIGARSPAPSTDIIGPVSGFINTTVTDLHKVTPLAEEKLRHQLKSCDAIRYAAYRTAVKIDVVQQALRTSAIKLATVTSVFHHHGLGNDVVLDKSEAAEVVSNLFYTAAKSRSSLGPPMDLEALSAASLRFALNVFATGQEADGNGNGGIVVRALKVFFAVFSEGRLREKLSYLFRHFSETNGILTKAGLTVMFSTLAYIAEYFGESANFGRGLVELTVSGVVGSHGMSEEAFLRWMLQEPQIVVWLPTHFRLVCAKGVRHGVPCRSCRMEDIIGLRYQCLRCLNYDLCQHCFFYGHRSRQHKLEHPMQEYCHKGSRKDSARAFLKLVVNKLRKRKVSQVKARYLSTLGAASSGDDKSDNGSSGFHSESGSNASGSPCGTNRVDLDPGALDHTVIRRDGDHIISQHQKVLHSIVFSMEEQNNEIMENFRVLESGKTPPLIDNCIAMQTQLNRLKELMDNIFSVNGQSVPVAVASTPMTVNHRTRESLDVFGKSNGLFSPIVSGNLTRQSPSKNGIMTNGSIQRRNRANRSVSRDDETSTSSHLASLSDVSMSDISSFLVKTGKIDPQNNDLIAERKQVMEITKGLGGDGTSRSGDDGDDSVAMEELETLMLRLDNVFQSFHLEKQTGFSSVVANRVSDIADQIQSFAYQYRTDHDL